MTMICDGYAIRSRPSIKYLGVQIYSKMGYARHAEPDLIKAATAIRQLGYLMTKVRGPKHKTRKLLASLVMSTLLYGAPIWADSMQ